MNRRWSLLRYAQEAAVLAALTLFLMALISTGVPA